MVLVGREGLLGGPCSDAVLRPVVAVSTEIVVFWRFALGSFPPSTILSIPEAPVLPRSGGPAPGTIFPFLLFAPFPLLSLLPFDFAFLLLLVAFFLLVETAVVPAVPPIVAESGAFPIAGSIGTSIVRVCSM